MDSTGTADFRARMKEWFDAAENEPIKITRTNQKSVVIISQKQFDSMLLELQEYRDVIKGLKSVAEGKMKPFSKDALRAAADKGKAAHKVNKQKKAVG